jgi:hypothetical protein
MQEQLLQTITYGLDVDFSLKNKALLRSGIAKAVKKFRLLISDKQGRSRYV